MEPRFKGQGTGQIRSLNRGFVISKFLSIYFTFTGAEKAVRYIAVRCIEVLLDLLDP